MPPGSKRSSHLKPTDVEGPLVPVPIDEISYDTNNPRIAEVLGDEPTQSQIEHLLLGEMRARELVPSFKENGYIPYEPLILRDTKAGRVVIEGNRRLAAIRSMSKSDDPSQVEAFQRHHLAEVPSLIFHGEERELLAYLGLRHLSKTKDWSARAKASFVERILRQGHDLKEAARLTNTTTNSLRLMLLTRRLLEEANALGLDFSGADGEIVFWHLGDAIRRRRTKTYLELIENEDPLQPPDYDQTKLEYLISWLYGNRKTRQGPVINSIRDIGALDRCLGDPRASRELENGQSLAVAEEMLETGGANVSGHLDRAKRSVKGAMSGLSDVSQEGIPQVQKSSDELGRAYRLFSSAFEDQRKELELRKDGE